MDEISDVLDINNPLISIATKSLWSLISYNNLLCIIITLIAVYAVYVYNLAPRPLPNAREELSTHTHCCSAHVPICTHINLGTL